MGKIRWGVNLEFVRYRRQVFDLAPEIGEKKGALAMLERFPSPEAIAMGQAALSDPAVSAEAKSALEHLRAVAAGDARLLVYTRTCKSCLTTQSFGALGSSFVSSDFVCAGSRLP